MAALSNILRIGTAVAALSCVLQVLCLQAAGAERSEMLAAKAALDARYCQQLEQLAARCQELGLETQARQTLGWIIRQDPGRTYLFNPAVDDPLRPQPDQPQLVQQWYAKLAEYRQSQAAALFELARSVAVEQPTLAYRWLHEVLREDADHAEARRVLGYRRGESGWSRPERTTRVRQATRIHPQLAWPPRTYWWVESQHFRIATNHSAQAGVELAETLEELHEVWQQVFFQIWARDGSLVEKLSGSDVPLGSTRRHIVVLFRDHDNYIQQLSAIEPRITVSLGYYLDRLSTAFFYAGDSSAQATWLHEATHQLMHERSGAGAEVGGEHNFWAIEGVALYMESLRKHDGYFTVGGFDTERLQFARYRTLNERSYIPLQKLVLYGRETMQQDEEIRRLYTQAAGLSHFLIDDDNGRYADAFRRYLTEIYAARDTAETLSAVVNAPWDTLNEQYVQFLDVTDKDLQYLANGPQLQNLCLGHTAVSDAGLLHLKGQRELQWLDLAYTATTDTGLQAFVGAAGLRQLNLEHTQITDKSLETLMNFRHLEELDLSGTRITDEATHRLAKLKDLKVLWLTSTQITDAGLAPLAQLKQLEMLDISHTSVTPEGWQRLKQQLPKLENE